MWKGIESAGYEFQEIAILNNCR
uniref:Uncharacterized protein n=1 Tax=Arundo donax TaxID=35708 RepID=A0A0A9AUU8_ARUDO